MHLTIILRNCAEYHLILSRRGPRPSCLNQGIFCKIEQDNCFIIQQFLIDYHFQNEKNYGSMMKTLKVKSKQNFNQIKKKSKQNFKKSNFTTVHLKRLFFTNSCLEMTRQSKEDIAILPRISPLPVN